jgi:hypothetical protein
MVELTAPDSTSLETARLGRPASRIAEELGSLADLVGTWFGTHGCEMIAEFFARPDGDGLIMWPHVNVNTLRKQ